MSLYFRRCASRLVPQSFESGTPRRERNRDPPWSFSDHHKRHDKLSAGWSGCLARTDVWARWKQLAVRYVSHRPWLGFVSALRDWAGSVYLHWDRSRKSACDHAPLSACGEFLPIYVRRE